MAKPERRDRDGEVRLDSDTNAIRGVGAVYYDGTPETEFQLWDGGVERIAPGTFDEPVERDDVRGLFNHDPSMLLGRTASGTMDLRSTDRGLEYSIKPANTTTYEDVSEHLRRGDISGSSFAFTVSEGGDSWSKEQRDGQTVMVRTISDVVLYDTGPVTYPAYSGTSSEFKSEIFAEARASLDSFRGLDPDPEPVTESEPEPATEPEPTPDPEPVPTDNDVEAYYAARARLAQIGA